MASWNDWAKAFSPEETQRRLVEARQKRREIAEKRDARLAQMGRLPVHCPVCGTRAHVRSGAVTPRSTCAVCLTHLADGTPSDEGQVVRTYRGADVAKAMRAEAALMAKAGWRVQSQAYGGQQSAGMAVLAFGELGLGATRKPKEITVVYTREARARA
ncbi:MAG: hypothetical protein IVW57_00180 [Ktedonobacterales bacterium]|nr:hypothetical protein [Ktedonobacterales bacterium]